MEEEMAARVEAIYQRRLENTLALSATTFVVEVLLAQSMARMPPEIAQGFADDLASPFRQTWGAEAGGLTDEDLRNAQARINVHVDQLATRALHRAGQIRAAR